MYQTLWLIFLDIGLLVIEYLFVEIKGQNWTALVGVVYRPRGDISDLTDILTDVGSRYTNIIIMGDFNLDREKILFRIPVMHSSMFLT